MIYIGEVEKEIIGFGVFKPGQEVDFNETLFATGLFSMKENVIQNEKVGAE
jgi:hypothetical protein